ncbi:serine hydrolase domain-containing protein [uncultured Roseivirga sp.]|uniref:serine hydrolase domain-containing protein n=1 Tax=uncultured Roseivirga sp. TaxID=543088 RepID=UPI00258E827D|nr:serine hydrolase domain-containing protein [uncultured Roseivirga sp.]
MLRPLTILLVLLCSYLNVRAQIEKRMDSIAQLHVAQGFNGNVLYSKGGNILFTGNYGYSNFVKRDLLNDSTRFELASNTKQITAVAIIQLVEQGLIHYNQDIQEILPNFPYKGILVNHLLRHQSGLEDSQKLLTNKKIWNRKRKANSSDILEVLIEHKPALLFQPGTEYKYSNTGYNILAIIIERVSGMSYSQYLHENIFEPANMKTAMVVSLQIEPNGYKNSALGYTIHHKKATVQRANKDKNHNHLNWMRTINGGAGVYASMLDVYQWYQALQSNALISEESKNLMFSPDTISPKYGLGVAVYSNTAKGKWIYHTGSWGGAKTMVLYLPDTEELIVILSNNRYENTYKTFDEDLYKLLLAENKQ